MIDMHTHILPNVDDGISNIEEAIAVLERGKFEGIDTFVLTPHLREESDWEKIDCIKKSFDVLSEECKERELDVKLILGAELFLTIDLPQKLKQNKAVIIGERYALVELPFSQLPIYTDEVLFELLVKDITPIIAHPERYLYLNNKLEKIGKWIENGIILQINTGSLLGKYGIRTKWFAKKLLKSGFTCFLGSDIHSINDKLCSFSEALRIIAGISIKGNKPKGCMVLPSVSKDSKRDADKLRRFSHNN
mgnify:CR=1 FL=1